MSPYREAADCQRRYLHEAAPTPWWHLLRRLRWWCRRRWVESEHFRGQRVVMRDTIPVEPVPRFDADGATEQHGRDQGLHYVDLLLKNEHYRAQWPAFRMLRESMLKERGKP